MKENYRSRGLPENESFPLTQEIFNENRMGESKTLPRVLTASATALNTLLHQNIVEKLFEKSWEHLSKIENLLGFKFHYLLQGIKIKDVVPEIVSRVRDRTNDPVFNISSDHTLNIVAGLAGQNRDIIPFSTKLSFGNTSRHLTVDVFTQCDVDDKNVVQQFLEDILSPFLAQTIAQIDVKWVTIQNGQTVTHNVTRPLDDVVHDEAYPYIKGPLDDFIDEYHQSDASVLLLTGMQGTGKTRLIRRILQRHCQKRLRGETITSSNWDVPSVLWTENDRVVTDDDVIFVSYATGDADYLIIEDADKLIQPRKEGNDMMKKLLNLADGILGIKRNIILTTNQQLDSVDEALVRPGRCFAKVESRKLTYDEAKALLDKLEGVMSLPNENRGYTVGEVYAYANGEQRMMENTEAEGRKTGFGR